MTVYSVWAREEKRLPEQQGVFYFEKFEKHIFFKFKKFLKRILDIVDVGSYKRDNSQSKPLCILR
jgi:hypothetical protein